MSQASSKAFRLKYIFLMPLWVLLPSLNVRDFIFYLCVCMCSVSSVVGFFFLSNWLFPSPFSASLLWYTSVTSRHISWTNICRMISCSQWHRASLTHRHLNPIWICRLSLVRLLVLSTHLPVQRMEVSTPVQLLENHRRQRADSSRARAIRASPHKTISEWALDILARLRNSCNLYRSMLISAMA